MTIKRSVWYSLNTRRTDLCCRFPIALNSNLQQWKTLSVNTLGVNAFCVSQASLRNFKFLQNSALRTQTWSQCSSSQPRARDLDAVKHSLWKHNYKQRNPRTMIRNQSRVSQTLFGLAWPLPLRCDLCHGPMPLGMSHQASCFCISDGSSATQLNNT